MSCCFFALFLLSEGIEVVYSVAANIKDYYFLSFDASRIGLIRLPYFCHITMN